MSQVERLRRIFEKLDRLYAEKPSPTVEKLYDDLLRGIEEAVKARSRIFAAPRARVEERLKQVIDKVEPEIDKLLKTTPSGLVESLKRLKSVFENMLSSVENQQQAILSKKNSLEERAKALIKAGRLEEARALTPAIAQLERSYQLMQGYVVTLRRAISRIEAITTGLELLMNLSRVLRIDVRLLKREELQEYLKQLKEARKTIEQFESNLAEIQKAIDMAQGIPSALYTEEERRVFQRLLDEVMAEAGLTEDVRKQIEEYKKQLEQKEREAEKVLQEMEGGG